MKYLKILIAFILISGCQTVKYTYGSEKLDVNDKMVIRDLKSLNIYEADKSEIVFTGSFDKTNVKIVNGDKVICNKMIETLPQLGLAGVYIIKNNVETQISIENKKLKLKSDIVKNYKFVYIERTDDGKNIDVNYSNIRRSFK